MCMYMLKITLLYLYLKVSYYLIYNLNVARSQRKQPTSRESQFARSQLHSENVTHNVT